MLGMVAPVPSKMDTPPSSVSQQKSFNANCESGRNAQNSQLQQSFQGHSWLDNEIQVTLKRAKQFYWRQLSTQLLQAAELGNILVH